MGPRQWLSSNTIIGMEFIQEISSPHEIGKKDEENTIFENVSIAGISFDHKNSILSESHNSVMNDINNHDDSSDSNFPYYNTFHNSDTKLNKETTNLKNAAPAVLKKGFSIIENESKYIKLKILFFVLIFN